MSDDKIVRDKATVAIREAASAKDAAKAMMAALKPVCIEMGQNPSIEMFCRCENGVWRFSWEAGPYDWAIAPSLMHGNPDILAEPYYGFDLQFYDVKAKS